MEWHVAVKLRNPPSRPAGFYRTYWCILATEHRFGSKTSHIIKKRTTVAVGGFIMQTGGGGGGGEGARCIATMYATYRISIQMESRFKVLATCRADAFAAP